MKRLGTCRASLALALASILLPAVSDGQGPARWKLLFSDGEDVCDVWGQLRFGATPVRRLGECHPPGFTLIGCFPLPDGSWEVYGQRGAERSPGKEPYERIMAWSLVRCVTRDGRKFEDVREVFQSPPAAWTDHAAIACRPDPREYLLRARDMDCKSGGR